jgi:heme-degrading monooxygenase HmoA
MIGRMWRGWAESDKAGDYEQIFTREVQSELHQIAGFRGAYLLRRDEPEGTELTTLTLFDSLDAVRAFAGENYETAVVLPAAQAVLRDYDRTVRHYTVVVAPSDPA